MSKPRLVTLKWIAENRSVTYQTIKIWRKKFLDFPKPKALPVKPMKFDYQEVRKFFKRKDLEKKWDNMV